MSPVWHLNERDRLAGEVARRIWLQHGGRVWVDARDEGTLLLLEALIAGHLDAKALRASLGLRYLEALMDTMCRADYEDARSLAKEARWVEGYLAKHARSALLQDEAKDGAFEGENAGARRMRLYGTLVRLAEEQLREAGVPVEP